MKSWLLIVTLLFGISPVQAASSIAVAPALQQIVLNQEGETTQAHVQLKNNTESEVSFTLSAVNFGSLDDSSGLIFQGQGISQLDAQYSLTNWISISPSKVTIPPGLEVDIAVTVTNLPDLSPGGHYAAVLATTDSGAGIPNTVGLKQALSSLLFVTKKGGENYEEILSGISIPKTTLQLPDAVQIQVQNKGNVHIVPRGLVQVIGYGNQVVAQGAINEDSSLLLPGTNRWLKVPLHQTALLVWPGQYRVRVSLRYDGSDTLINQEKIISYTGIPLLGIIATLCLFGFVLILRRKKHRRSPSKV